MTEIHLDKLPLAGVRVLEFCSIAAGPFCGMLLSDMGAEVTKIEPPGGDALRAWPPISAGFSENFASLNRNKRSVVLDLKNPVDLATALALASEADVVVENNRPGVMDRLGLGWPQLTARNPALVYCSISAFGQSGPRSREGGFDLTIQAAAGVMSVTGDSEAPVKCGVPVSDFASGLYGAFSISSALVKARATGIGVHLDVPMFGCTLAIAALQTSEYFGTGRSPGKLGSAHPRNAPYEAFKASDGHIAIAAGNDSLWRSVLAAVGRPELADDPRFASPTLRAANQTALKEILETHFVHEPVAYWIEVFNRAGVPHSRINTYEQALADPQVTHMGCVQDLELPGGTRTRTFTSPVRINGQRIAMRSNPPSLGEHTAQVRDALLIRQRD
ncbi:Succinyl-CoA:(R)-benzylsuccinate CoA-transferase subunit BbsF [Variovorax sp. PBL-H6]|uniref:CaiB/BaiF CoA transferase family protein n=1 Tax=Variovorax sp. PBL-H6 TaxID=434009 RepID=UPI001316B8CE|nr:CoA transferase [Variovorax sp. PBL-H6]VTU33448.1 Succinyl-CoA:(R)-benzylsuccinate CoA-transferase subunit BbsF [Variovorax sp. PBL-H6]